MKKILSLLVCLVLVLSLSVTASAANATATLNGVPAEIKKDNTATITVNLSGSPSITSALVQVTFSNGLELVSGEWKKDGLMKDFTVANGYGVLALSSAGAVDGTVFSFVIKGKTVSASQSIKVTFTFKNGNSEVGTATVNKTVKVVCTSCSFGNWTQTKAPKCAEKGSEKRTCSVCQKVETRDIAATGHAYGNWTTTKEPTCDVAGTQTRTCSKCSGKDTKAIAPLGHKFSNPTVTKEPTCTETGIKEGTCTVCSKKTTESIDVKEHNYGKAVVTKEATKTETGIKTKTCADCGHKVEEEIPMLDDSSNDDITSTPDEPTDAPTTEGGFAWYFMVITGVLGLVIGFVLGMLCKKSKK